MTLSRDQVRILPRTRGNAILVAYGPHEIELTPLSTGLPSDLLLGWSLKYPEGVRWGYVDDRVFRAVEVELLRRRSQALDELAAMDADEIMGGQG